MTWQWWERIEVGVVRGVWSYRLPDGVLLKSESSYDSLLFLMEILGIVDELGHLEEEEYQEGGGRGNRAWKYTHRPPVLSRWRLEWKVECLLVAIYLYGLCFLWALELCVCSPAITGHLVRVHQRQNDVECRESWRETRLWIDSFCLILDVK